MASTKSEPIIGVWGTVHGRAPEKVVRGHSPPPTEAEAFCLSEVQIKRIFTILVIL